VLSLEFLCSRVYSETFDVMDRIVQGDNLQLASDVHFGIHQLVINLMQPAMRAVGVQSVFRGQDQVAVVRRRQFKVLGDAHRLIGRCLRAQSAGRRRDRN